MPSEHGRQYNALKRPSEDAVQPEVTPPSFYSVATWKRSDTNAASVPSAALPLNIIRVK